ncbi:MAG: hypothetical protein ABI885_21840 [Gammaproteobacteria bacterium]
MTERRPDTPLPPAAHEQAERLVAEVLSQQPLRPAPRTLESRVLREIERRAALPWWRNSFMHWPLIAQFFFLLTSVGAVKLVLSAAGWALTDLRFASAVAAVTAPLSWVGRTAHFFATLADMGSVVLAAVPPHYLYVGLFVAATLYVALFVLGATAYRTLYLNK